MSPEDVEAWAALGWAAVRGALCVAVVGVVVMLGGGLGHMVACAWGLLVGLAIGRGAA